MKKTNHILSYEDRLRIERLLALKFNKAQIAKAIGFHFTTVHRELKRCEKGRYSADAAQKSLKFKKLPN